MAMAAATMTMIMIMIYANYIHITYQALGLLGKCIPQTIEIRKITCFVKKADIYSWVMRILLEIVYSTDAEKSIDPNKTSRH